MTAIRLSPHIVLIPREDWHAEAAQTSRMHHRTGARECYVHHSTDRLAEHIDTLAEQKMMARAIQHFHMHDPSRGWADIGYNFLVFQPWGARKYARIFEGRRITYDPAAQEGHNDNTVAVCVFGNFDHDDKVFDNTRHALEVLVRTKLAPFGVTSIGGHRDAPGQSTECPGDTLERAVDIIAHATRLRRIR